MGQEWKNLVESSMTSQSPPVGPADNPRTRESPVQFAPTGNSAAGAGISGTKSGSVDPGDEEVKGQALLPQPSWSNSDVKIDVLRELEDIASMTILETGFFCK